MGLPKNKNQDNNNSEISECEKKRLESLREKKKAFKAKEQAVQNALRNLDNKTSKNKIVFDDDIDKIVEPKVKEKRKKKDLFDDGNSEDESKETWDDSHFNVKKTKTGLPIRANLTLGNDSRFKLDERFMENDDVDDGNEVTENSEGLDLEKEKEWQLDILGNVLGKPIAPKVKDVDKDSKPAKKTMIRYDPTENGHKEYEIHPEKSEPDAKKAKKKKKTKEVAAEVEENQPVEVSKDIYYSVSDSLTKSLKEGGQFSLLKSYGKEESNVRLADEKNGDDLASTESPKFRFNFDTKNPFKYDSSEDENESEKANEKSIDKRNEDEQQTKSLFAKTDRLFFVADDPRFNEAIQFFSKEPTPSNEFNNLRRKLKQIVHSKIQKNTKKNQVWGGKKKVRKTF